jgi:TadE-like protein
MWQTHCEDGDRVPVRSKLRSAPASLLNERGTALTELALVLPLLFVALLGIVDFGRALNYWIDETHLANEGVRFAVVNSNPGTSPQSLQSYIRNQADFAGADVCISFPNGTSLIGDPVQVKVQYTYNWLHFLTDASVPVVRRILPNTTKQIISTATMRIEQKPTNYAVSNNPATCT